MTTTAEAFATRELARPTRWMRAKKQARRNPTIIVGIVMVGLVLVVGLLGPFLAPYDPLKQNYRAAVEAPSAAHWLGTDKFGRDQLSRILYGARIDLGVGIITALVPLAIGIMIGSISGYYGGKVDTLFMRIIEIQVAFPFYVLLIAIIAVMGPGLLNMYYALILVELGGLCQAHTW